jgi:hypothetical protein
MPTTCLTKLIPTHFPSGALAWHLSATLGENMGMDESLSRCRQRIEKLLEDRDCHLHAGLKLLHPDLLPLQD